jgi:hypothetical protein
MYAQEVSDGEVEFDLPAGRSLLTPGNTRAILRIGMEDAILYAVAAHRNNIVLLSRLRDVFIVLKKGYLMLVDTLAAFFTSFLQNPNLFQLFNIIA